MELIAPWNKESLFLTVTEYNDSAEPILAVASVTKDQPFFNTAGGGVYIAAESFRLSAFASDLGYIYQMLKPEWFISGQQHAQAVSEQDTKIPTNLITTGINIYDQEDGPSVTRMEIQLQPQQQSIGISSIYSIQNQMAAFLNDYRVCQNSTISIDASGGTRLYKLVTDPAEQMNADGFGDRGLSDVPFTITEVVQLSGEETYVRVINQEAKNWCITAEVLKRDLPSNTTFKDLKIYFSNGLYCFADTLSNATDWSHLGEFVLEILGPYKMLAEHASVNANVISSEDYGGQPQVRCWIVNNRFFEENSLFTFHYNGHDNTANVRDDENSGFKTWFFEDSDSYRFKLSVQFNHTDGNALQKANNFVQNYAAANPAEIATYGLRLLVGSRFFAYDNHRSILHTVRAEATVELLQGEPLDAYTTETLINLHEKDSVAFNGTVARTLTPDNEYPVISPNEMFQIYNGTDQSGEHMWLLNGHANGGFQITIKKNMDVFKINKDFFDRMGLDPNVVSYETIGDSNRSSVGLLCIPVFVPDDNGTSVDKPQEDINFSNWVTEIDVSQCETWDGNMINPTPQILDQMLDSIVRKIGVEESVSYYRMLNYFPKKSSGGTTRQAWKKAGRIEDGPDGPEYVFTNVSAGDYIQNLQYVSVESFSMFEAIQLCVPSTPFQPMITSYSSGMRVLAELRLDFPVGPQSGPDGANQGTNDFWVGDIQWSASNGHQYLQLSTAQQSIYNLEIRAQLVYRNANAIPPKPIWIAPRGGLFQCKIRLVSVK